MRSAWVITSRRMGEDQRRRFVHEVAKRMPAPVIDYVRLNIRARRGSSVPE